jgi:putative redox protein
MEFQKITFENKQGQKLGARLDLPVDGQPVAFALFAHCFTCTKNLKAAGNISRALTRQGIAVLRFDFTGLGESEGDFAETNFSSNVADLVAAADFLEQAFEAPQILIGHSLGGAAVLQAAAHVPASVAVVTIGAPSEPSHVLRLLEGKKEMIEAKGEAKVTLAGRTFMIKKQFLDDLAQTRMQDAIRNLRRALLIMHAPLDNTVGIDNAAQIFQAARHPKSFISLDQADHLLSDERDSRYVGALIATWARKYLKRLPEDDYAADPADNQIVVRTGPSGYRTEIIANGHSLVADEPLAAGGTNLGPTPYDYLVAGLGACTAITLRMYADRKAWPLEAIVVRLYHQKIHAEDCADCETKSGKIDQIEREIELVGPLDDEQRQRLLEIADKCPVHRTLHSEIVVRTRLKD